MGKDRPCWHVSILGPGRAAKGLSLSLGLASGMQLSKKGAGQHSLGSRGYLSHHVMGILPILKVVGAFRMQRAAKGGQVCIC